jgi:hypothetical protein
MANPQSSRKPPFSVSVINIGYLAPDQVECVVLNALANHCGFAA